MGRLSMRAIILALALTGPALAGCLASPAPQGLGPTGLSGLEELPFAFEGIVTAGITQQHPLVLTEEDVLEISLTLEYGAPLFGIARARLLGPEGQVLAASLPSGPSRERLAVFRNVLEDVGPGQYTVSVGASLLGNVPYSIVGKVVRGEVPEPLVLQEAPSSAAANGVVVAVIDTGINPYHVAFRADGPPAPGVHDAVNGSAPMEFPLTFSDTYEEALRADDPAWRGVERGKLYHFPGTRLYAISMVDPEVEDDYYPLLDEYGHGTQTSASVLQVEPAATIVLIEVSGSSWHEIVDAIEWAAAQPWIDVVSASMGNLGNTPVWREPLFDDGDLEPLPRATKKAAEAGKLVVFSAGNDPSVSFTDTADGPPWVISVTGAEPSMRGRDVLPSNFADFASNFTVRVASHTSTTETKWIQGTSFACPTMSGSFARAILGLRLAANHEGGSQDGFLVRGAGIELTAGDFRDAFNRTAVYWNFTDYDPRRSPGDVYTQLVATSVPVLPTPWLQMGWGYVDAAVADATIRHLLATEETPAKSLEAVAYMEAQQAARAALWDALL